jgi:hypothetical protein
MVRYPFDTLTVLSLSALLKTLRVSKGNVEGLTTNGKSGTYKIPTPFALRFIRLRRRQRRPGYQRENGDPSLLSGKKGVSMAKSYEGFSFKEHQRIGKQIIKLRHQMKALDRKVTGAYGKSSKPAKFTEKILKDLGLLQNELNDKVCQENPSSGKLELLACYYPKEG